MNNKKLIWGVVVVVVLIFVVWAVQNKGTTKNATTGKETIKIGIVGPLTGGASVYGVNLVKGTQIALENLSKTTKYDYKLIVEDDGTNPAQSASAAQKLISADGVKAIITVTSGTGNAVKPIATNAKIPQVCLCSDSKVADGQYNFTNIIMPDDEATAWLKEAQSQGIKKIAIISQNQPGFNLLIANIQSHATSSGITVVYSESVDPTIKDFKTSIAKAKATKPDFYLIGFFPPQIDIIGQELKTLGITNFAGMATFSIGADPSLFNDRWYSDASLSDPAFATAFTKEFPDTRFNVRVAPYAYDTLNLLVNGFESGSPTNHLLNLTSYPGKAGTITKNAGEASFHAPVGIWTIKNGVPAQLK